MEPFIRISGLRKTYIMGRVQVHALDGVDMEIPPNSFMVVMGPSGSGKSTLLHLLGGLDRPSAGHIEVGGQSLETLDENALAVFRRRAVGFIFQSFNLIPVLDVYENVELPLLINERIPAAERRDRVLQAVADVELQHFARHLPDKLSGGQRQRVAIARALVTSPLLVLADEPTANLDSATAHRIIDLMLALNEARHVTFFFSTHDEKLMSRVARVLRISDGLIVGDSDREAAGAPPTPAAARQT
jgi:putative ABC transport system ATP-binding protein